MWKPKPKMWKHFLYRKFNVPLFYFIIQKINGQVYTWKKVRAKINNEYIILPHSFPDPEKLKDQLSKKGNIYMERTGNDKFLFRYYQEFKTDYRLYYIFLLSLNTAVMIWHLQSKCISRSWCIRPGLQTSGKWGLHYYLHCYKFLTKFKLNCSLFFVIITYLLDCIYVAPESPK